MHWPEDDINVHDATPDVPAVLEKFFVDDDIEEIVKTSFHVSEMNDDFYEKYTSVAKTFIWKKILLTLQSPFSDFRRCNTTCTVN